MIPFSEPITIPMLFSTERELLTPPLNGLILPGVVRNSLLSLSRQWNQFKVMERAITMKEIIQLNSKNRVSLYATLSFLFVSFFFILLSIITMNFFVIAIRNIWSRNSMCS